MKVAATPASRTWACRALVISSAAPVLLWRREKIVRGNIPLDILNRANLLGHTPLVLRHGRCGGRPASFARMMSVHIGLAVATGASPLAQPVFSGEMIDARESTGRTSTWWRSRCLFHASVLTYGEDAPTLRKGADDEV